MRGKRGTGIIPRLGPLGEEYEWACLERARLWESLIPFAEELMQKEKAPAPPGMTRAVAQALGLL